MADVNEMGDVVSDASSKKEACSDRVSNKKKMRSSPPEIDRHLQLKWGLALLGEEKSKEYLVWLREKIHQTLHQ